MADLVKIREILDNIDNIRESVKYIYQVKNKLVDFCLSNRITEQEFYRITSILTPQSRSPLWEKYFREKIDAKKVSPKDNKGDLLHGEIFYEHKVSHNNNDEIHLVQIRLWQGCDYIVQSINPNGTADTFKLTHTQMKNEMKKLGANSAHGTEEANKKNKNVELRVTINTQSDHYKRWRELYLTDEFD